MKPKHLGAFLIVLASIMFFAFTSLPLLETLTTPKARVLFVIPFVFVLIMGIGALCFLFTETFKAEKEQKELIENAEIIKFNRT